MPYFREFVMPLLVAIIVGVLVWAYWTAAFGILLCCQMPTCQTATLPITFRR